MRRGIELRSSKRLLNGLKGKLDSCNSGRIFEKRNSDELDETFASSNLSIDLRDSGKTAIFEGTNKSVKLQNAPIELSGPDNTEEGSGILIRRRSNNYTHKSNKTLKKKRDQKKALLRVTSERRHFSGKSKKLMNNSILGNSQASSRSDGTVLVKNEVSDILLRDYTDKMIHLAQPSDTSLNLRGLSINRPEISLEDGATSSKIDGNMEVDNSQLRSFPQKSHETESSDNSEADEGEDNLHISCDYAKSIIKKCIYKVISSVTRSKNISKQLFYLRNLSEKLSFASAYAVMGDRILGKAEIKELSAVLIKVINSCPNTSRLNYSKASKTNNSEDLQRTNTQDLSELVILACNCLSLIVEDSAEDSKIVMRNGAVRAFVKRLNGKNHEIFAEHIIGLIYKISVEYPASLTSRELRTSIIKNIDLLDVHVQRSALEAIFNILSAYTSHKKRGTVRKTAQEYDCRDLGELTNVIGGYLFSSDYKVIEYSIHCIAKITELCVKQNVSAETLFNERYLKRFSELLAMSVGLVQTDIPNYTPLIDANLQNSNGRAGLQASQALSFLIRTMIILSQSSPDIRLKLVKEYNILEIILHFFTNSNSNTPKPTSYALKNHTLNILLGTDDSKAFDILYLLDSLISFQPTAQDLLNILNKESYVTIQSLSFCSQMDIEIANRIVECETLVFALTELLDSNYNFYTTYEVLCILTKVLWCSSNLPRIATLLTSSQIISKIICHCFEIGITYYHKPQNRSIIIEHNYISDRDLSHKPHYFHAQALFECGLKLCHLLAIRFGDTLLIDLGRNGIDNYLSNAISTLKKYYGTVEYYLRRRKMSNKEFCRPGATRGTDLYSTEFSRIHDSIKSSEYDDSSVIERIHFEDFPPLKHLSPSPRPSRDTDFYPTVSLQELNYYNINHPIDRPNSSKKRSIANSYNEENLPGISLDNSSDDLNRVIFELCERLLSQITKLRQNNKKSFGEFRYAIKLAATDLNKQNNKEDPLNIEVLKKVIEGFDSSYQTSLTAVELLNSGILHDIISYIGDIPTLITQLDYEKYINYNSEDSPSKRLEAFLNILARSTNSSKRVTSFGNSSIQVTLINLLNNSLSLLTLFPYLCPKKIGNFSIPPRSSSVLHSYLKNASDQSKKILLWPNIPDISEYFTSQLEKRILLKLTTDDPTEPFQELSGTMISAHCLSTFSSLQLNVSKTVFGKSLMISDLQKVDKVEVSESDHLQLKPYVLRIYDKDVRNSPSIYDRSSPSSSGEPSEYEVNDNTTESDIVNFFVNEGRYIAETNISFLPQDERQLFGISDPENPNSPIVINLTDIDLQSILDPNCKPPSISTTKLFLKFVEDLMGDFVHVLPETARCRSRYSLRKERECKDDNENYASVSKKKHISFQESTTEVNKPKIDLFIGSGLLNGTNLISKTLYDNYIYSSKKPVYYLYERFYEIGVKQNENTNETLTSNLIHQPPSSISPSFSFTSPAKEILLLQKILFESRSVWAGSLSLSLEDVNTLFINSSITARVLRQLEDPITAFSKIFPIQCHELLTEYKFLFPLKLRLFYFNIMSLNMPKVTCIWKERKLNNFKLIHEDTKYVNKIRRMGNLSRINFKINRYNILETAMHIFFDYGSVEYEITIEYKDEVGAGLGPTLEFYANICIEIQKASYSNKNSTVMFPLWRNTFTPDGLFVSREMGLFPAPIPPLMKRGLCAEKTYSKMLYNVLRVFALLGIFVAKSISDHRLIDIPLNKLFIDMAFLGKKYNPGLESIELIKYVDLTFYNSLKHIMEYVNQKKQIMNSSLSPEHKRLRISQIKFNGLSLEDLCLDFTYPGYTDFKLIPNGANILVDIENVEKYLEYIADYTVGSGIYKQLSAFKKGFDSVIPIYNMKCFYSEEIIDIISDESKGLSFDYIISNIKTDHGYTTSSPTIINFANVVSSFTTSQLRMFIQFITGSTRLPIDGLKGLTPQLTIVKRFEQCANPDDHLPSVMTCMNYLKLPDYSSIDVLRSKLLYSISEGLNSFHLS